MISPPSNVVLPKNLHPFIMAVTGFKSDLSEPFKAVSFLSVVLNSVFSDMAIMAAPDPQSPAFRKGAICNTAQDVMPFQTDRPSTEETTFSVLDYAFACHDESISSCSFDAGIGSPICSASSIR